jgi:exopolysaccharide biosynthesis polyprenyl glycosylphosphotransferase
MNRNRQIEIVIPFLRFCTDILAILGSFLFSYWLRFDSPLSNIVPVTKGFPGFEVYFWSSWGVAIVWVFIFGELDLYGSRRNLRVIDEFMNILRAVTLGMLIVLAVIFFYRGFSYSRLVIMLIWTSSIVFLTLTRSMIILYERYLHMRGKGVLNAAIVGSSKWGEDLFQKIYLQPHLGIQMVGFVKTKGAGSGQQKIIGGFDRIDQIAKQHNIDIYFIALDSHENHHLLDIMNRCSGLNVEFYLVPDLLEMMTSRLRISEIEGIPVVKIKDTAITGWNSIIKRWFDVLVALIGLVLLWPVFIIIAVSIRSNSKGDIFYRQTRIGLDGQKFELMKFRTMVPDAEKETGPVWTQKDDQRVTSVGRFLRRTSLDELPQLLNVLKGEMSIVGPRPERPHFVEQFKARVPKYLERHRLRSGMTGWAQVNGFRGNVPIEERTKYDVFYVENWSLLFDLKIISLTFWAILKGENSY